MKQNNTLKKNNEQIWKGTNRNFRRFIKGLNKGYN